MGEQPREGTWAEALLAFVQRYPGVHLREIRRRLDIPIGTLDYHLYRLGKQGLVSVRFQDGYKCCYPETPPGTGTPISSEDQLFLSLLRQPVPRAVLLELYLEGPTSPAGLRRAIDATASNLSYFLNRLEAAKVIVRTGQGKERTVRLVDAKGIHRVLLAYPPLPDAPVDRFIRFWSELHP